MDETRRQKKREEYLSRINLILDFIDANICSTFTLEDFAEISGFSKFHFHRIFSSIMNETLYEYITRQRLEKAKAMLIIVPDKPITEIALDFGFSESATFARAFKKLYGISATEYRDLNRNIGKAQENTYLHNRNINNISKWRNEKMNIKADVKVKDVPEMTAIYLRHLGSYDELGKMFPGAIKKLVDFGIKNKLMIPGETKLFAIYHDNPNITSEDKLKTSICLSVPPDTKPDDEFGKMEIPAGKYAAGHFELDNAQQHSEAWTYMYGEWLPGSGFEPDDGFNYEVYLNDPNTHPQRKHLIDIYIPVKACRQQTHII